MPAVTTTRQITKKSSVWTSWHGEPTLDVLKAILGKVLVHERRGKRVSGIVIEAEAYIGEDDPACHAAPGPTRRNAPLYGPPGRVYVYLNYGMHYLVNVVTEAKGAPAAVLIRALAPLDGIPLMVKRRANGKPIHEADLCRGPGNLTRALGITLTDNLLDLTLRPGSGQASSRLYVEDRRMPRGQIAWGPRIGIRVGVDKPWRCWMAGHPSVSGPRTRRS